MKLLTALIGLLIVTASCKSTDSQLKESSSELIPSAAYIKDDVQKKAYRQFGVALTNLTDNPQPRTLAKMYDDASQYTHELALILEQGYGNINGTPYEKEEVSRTLTALQSARDILLIGSGLHYRHIESLQRYGHEITDSVDHWVVAQPQGTSPTLPDCFLQGAFADLAPDQIDFADFAAIPQEDFRQTLCQHGHEFSQLWNTERLLASVKAFLGQSKVDPATGDETKVVVKLVQAGPLTWDKSNLTLTLPPRGNVNSASAFIAALYNINYTKDAGPARFATIKSYFGISRGNVLTAQQEFPGLDWQAKLIIKLNRRELISIRESEYRGRFLISNSHISSHTEIIPVGTQVWVHASCGSINRDAKTEVRVELEVK